MRSEVVGRHETVEGRQVLGRQLSIWGVRDGTACCLRGEVQRNRQKQCVIGRQSYRPPRANAKNDVDKNEDDAAGVAVEAAAARQPAR